MACTCPFKYRELKRMFGARRCRNRHHNLYSLSFVFECSVWELDLQAARGLKVLTACQAQANRDIANLSKKLMPDKHLIHQVTGDEGPDRDDLNALYGTQNCKPFEALIDWKNHPEPEPFSAEMKATYEVFLAYVGSIYKGLQENEHPRRIFRRLLCLGVMLPISVIDLIEERRPRALAILAHYFAMAYSMNDHWLWYGLPDQEVDGIESLMPNEWMWAMDWPRRVLQELKTTPYGKEFEVF
jgi:hypothetical protein